MPYINLITRKNRASSTTSGVLAMYRLYRRRHNWCPPHDNHNNREGVEHCVELVAPDCRQTGRPLLTAPEGCQYTSPCDILAPVLAARRVNYF